MRRVVWSFWDAKVWEEQDGSYSFIAIGITELGFKHKDDAIVFAESFGFIDKRMCN